VNLNTILSALRDGIAGDEPLDLWSVATYGQRHSVYVGLDTNNPPAESAYPVISLYILGKTAGVAQDTITHTIGVACGVIDSTSTVNGDTNVTEYNGVARIEDFRKLIETAAVTALDALSLRMTELRTDFSPVSLFPYFLCDMELTIIEDMEFGSDMFG
jgi:hypothetical protein